MNRYLYITVASLLALPYLAYSAIQTMSPSNPDIVYVKEPSLFAGKWEKTASCSEFTEYIDQTKFEKNFDSTIEIVTMRNYYKKQVDDDSDKKLVYKSQVSHETIDCFNQTVSVSKMYFLSDFFTEGSLVQEPVEINTPPMKVKERSIGFSKVKMVCKLSNMAVDSDYIKSSFMNNI
jgi:hypothetical protein